MLGKIEVDSLNDVFRVSPQNSLLPFKVIKYLLNKIFVLNRKYLSEMRTIISPLVTTLSYM